MSEILYHYCSTATFFSIISNRSIRISSMSLSNDAMEGKMVLAVLKHLDKNKLLQSESGSIFPYILDQINNDYDGLAFCLSEEADLLSQWRGYADDGRGFCIGFSKTYLESLENPNFQEIKEFPLQLKKVLYQIGEQARSIEHVYELIATRQDALKAVMNDTSIALADQEKRKQLLVESMFTGSLKLVNSLFTLKSDAFKEEAEWRLIATVDSSTHSLGEFRPTPTNLIPFQTIQLEDNNPNSIVEVITGPKNQTPHPVLKNFLAKHNFGDASVSKSRASYR